MKRLLDSPTFWGIVMGILACLLLINWFECSAQRVIKQGTVFVQKDSSRIKKDNPTLTKYVYQTTDGTKYPIYMSANGKCFIIRTSKNGKQYKQYLPEITKQLSK